MAKLSELVAKATRKPYELELDDGSVIEVPQPTLEKWQDAPFTATVHDFLVYLGVSEEGAARAQEAVGKAPLGTADWLLSDMRGHFGLGN